MQPAPESSKPEPSANTLKESISKKLIELLVMAALGGIGKIALGPLQSFTSQPWQIVWFVLPLAGVSYIAWKFERKRFSLGRSPIIFTSCYVLIFFLLTSSRFLDLWERAPVGYEQQAPRNFMAMNRAGDWRYIFARQKPADRNFLIVTMEPAQTRVAARYDITRLIRLAVLNKAKVIAFDFYFKQNAEPRFDEQLCAEIKNANDKGVPVFVGYGFHFTQGEPIWEEITSNLRGCLPDQTQGHLIGYSEWDGRIRMIPLHFKNDPSKEALSLRFANALDKDHKLIPPEDGLLQFIKPATDIREISYETLWGSPQEREKLQDKFVLVGERSTEDTFSTPYSIRPGVVIHAFAIHSLHENHFIRRAPWWSAFGMILVSCYLMMILFSQKARSRRIALCALLASVIVFVASAAAMFFGLVWVDIIYPIAAIWLLFVLLVCLRRISRRKIQQTAPEPDTASSTGANP